MSWTRDTIRAEGEGLRRPSITCSKCGECVDSCSERAISYTFFGLLPADRARWIERLPERANHHPLAAVAARVAGDLLHPRTLFTFSAFLFGMVISGGFGRGTIHRLLNLAINGSYLLN